MGWGERAKPTPSPVAPSEIAMVKSEVEQASQSELHAEINYLTDYCMKYARGKGSMKIAQEVNRIRTKYGFDKLIMS